jgi:hypothetical protein
MSFKGGPDWILEKPLAMAAVTKWQFAVLDEHFQWQCQVDKLQNASDKVVRVYNTTQHLDYFFKTTKSGRYYFVFLTMKFLSFGFL